MAVAVTDAGPPHYLVLIGAIDLLPSLFDAVFLPDVVHAELRHPRAPASVRGWNDLPPPWLRIEPTPPVSTLPFPFLDDGSELRSRWRKNCTLTPY
jgi:hypothetical protein